MADSEDKRFEYIKDRIASAFPKLGSKLDKAITADDAKYVACNFLVTLYNPNAEMQSQTFVKSKTADAWLSPSH